LLENIDEVGSVRLCREGSRFQFQWVAFTLTPDFSSQRESVPKSDMTTVRVYVTLKPSLLDSAGRTVAQSLQKLGYPELHQARIGKMIELQVDAYDEVRVKEMCDKLLANPVIEDYRIEVGL